MQIEAIYESGTIKPLVPLKLKKNQVRIQIIIPDEHIEQAPVRRNSLRERIDSILGEFSHPGPGRTPEKDKAAWHEHLEEKYGA